MAFQSRAKQDELMDIYGVKPSGKSFSGGCRAEDASFISGLMKQALTNGRSVSSEMRSGNSASRGNGSSSPPDISGKTRFAAPPKQRAHGAAALASASSADKFMGSVFQESEDLEMLDIPVTPASVARDAKAAARDAKAAANGAIKDGKAQARQAAQNAEREARDAAEGAAREAKDAAAGAMNEVVGGLKAAAGGFLSSMGLGGLFGGGGGGGDDDDDSGSREVRFNGQLRPESPAAPKPSGGSFTRSISRSTSARLLSHSSSNAGRVSTRWLRMEGSKTQHALKSQAQALNKETLTKQAAKNDEEARFPRDTLNGALGAVGYGGLVVDEESGGLGLSTADAAVVFEELGKGDSALAGYLTIHNMVSYILDRFGKNPNQRRLLPNLSNLSLLGTYCMTEASSGSDPSLIGTVAEKDASGQYYLLHGSKSFVSAGGQADVMLVLARTSAQPTKGLSLFMVSRNLAGVTVTKPEKTTGWRSIPIATYSFNRCVVRTDLLVGKEGQGLDILNHALELQRTWLAAVSVGAGQFCMDYALQYCQGRRQFSKPVTEYQAVQFKFVEMHAQLASARLMVTSSAQGIDARSSSRSMESALTKRFATDAAFKVANDSLQLLGGQGLLAAPPIDRALRDLRAHLIVGGTNDMMASAVFKELNKQPGM